MKTAFTYSLKIWLCSVFISPLIYIAIIYITNSPPNINPSPESYFYIVLVELVLSFLTWLIFFLIIWLIGMFHTDLKLKKSLTAIIGVLLTIGTFFVLSAIPDSFSYDNILFNLLICNCLFIGAGSLLFRLD